MTRKYKYWIQQNNYDYSWWYTQDKSEKFIIHNGTNTHAYPCFVTLNSGINENTYKIVTLCPKEHMGFNEKTIIRFVKLLNDNKFYCDYMGLETYTLRDLKKERYRFDLYIDKLEGSRLYIISTLYLLRYLWMKGSCKIIDKMLTLLDENQELTFRDAIIEAHNVISTSFNGYGYDGWNSNHGLRLHNQKNIISQEEFDKIGKEFSIFKSKGDDFSIFKCW